MSTKVYKLKKKFLYKNINWKLLSLNPSDGAINMLLDNFEFIQWESFFCNRNERVLVYLEAYKDFINTNVSYFLSWNTSKKAVSFLIQNPELIHWDSFSYNDNTEAVKFMLKNPDRVNWKLFSMNTNDLAVNYFRKNLDLVNWEYLSLNTNNKAIRLFHIYPEMINFYNLSRNNCDEAIEILKANKENINWYNLSGNTNNGAIELLLENPNKIDQKLFSGNSNIKAVKYLENHKELIRWSYFCKNINSYALDIIEKIICNIETKKETLELIRTNIVFNHSPKAIDISLRLGLLDVPWNNPGIFEESYNYNFIRQRNSIIEEELMSKVWSPDRVHLWSEGNPYLDLDI
jgi:hypothetical protein